MESDIAQVRTGTHTHTHTRFINPQTEELWPHSVHHWLRQLTATLCLSRLLHLNPSGFKEAKQRRSQIAETICKQRQTHIQGHNQNGKEEETKGSTTVRCILYVYAMLHTSFCAHSNGFLVSNREEFNSPRSPSFTCRFCKSHTHTETQTFTLISHARIWIKYTYAHVWALI